MQRLIHFGFWILDFGLGGTGSRFRDDVALAGLPENNFMAMLAAERSKSKIQKSKIEKTRAPAVERLPRTATKSPARARHSYSTREFPPAAASFRT